MNEFNKLTCFYGNDIVNFIFLLGNISWTLSYTHDTSLTLLG